jgi:hypothetical protein
MAALRVARPRHSKASVDDEASPRCNNETALPRRSQQPYDSSPTDCRLIRLVEIRSLRPVAKMEGKMNIKLHAPTMLIFLISLVLAVLALIGYFVVIPYITMYGFWIAIIAYVVLAYGNVMEA